MLKIGSVVDAQSAEVDVKDPLTGKRIATIELAGPEHPRRKAIEMQKQRRMLAALSRTGKVELGDPVELEADRLDLLVACTLGWTEVCDEDGRPLEFNAENVRRLYSAEGHGWLRKQMLEAMEERDRFIRSFAVSS